MATRKSVWVLMGILVISAWVFGSAIQVGAETLNYKAYTWVTKNETVPIGDVEGHILGLGTRGAFYVFENGEVATVDQVSTNDFIKLRGSFMQYLTVKFEDGSTIIVRSHGTLGETKADYSSEIIKGTGRFEGIKGTQSTKVKFLPLQEGELGRRGYGEGTITYTLPAK